MGRTCIVVGCDSNSSDEMSFFRFPAIISSDNKKWMRSKENITELSKKRRNEWIRVLKRGNLSDKYVDSARICSLHFLSGNRKKLCYYLFFVEKYLLR